MGHKLKKSFIAPFRWKRTQGCEIYCTMARLFRAFKVRKVESPTVWGHKLKKYNPYHHNGWIRLSFSSDISFSCSWCGKNRKTHAFVSIGIRSWATNWKNRSIAYFHWKRTQGCEIYCTTARLLRSKCERLNPPTIWWCKFKKIQPVQLQWPNMSVFESHSFEIFRSIAASDDFVSSISTRYKSVFTTSNLRWKWSVKLVKIRIGRVVPYKSGSGVNVM